ncbi:unnamed protein product [Trichogramma brassicae]|uniref:WH1 domain-containing protein n=1 Tax=Trichogramma brassicae TaxID=86971 RepID=A0A6H5I9S0_9HYME|nr:unnamed protein product [Trichogramma brassicae]
MTSVNSSACAPASSGSSESDFRMNIAALKRVDPYVKTIIETATHVALYTFNGDSNEWEKTEIEGAMFVYSRIGEPYNSIIIMNSCEESIIAKLQKKANIAASNKPTQPLTLTEYAAAKTPNVADKSGRSDENHTSSFLRIQSPNAINSNAMQNRNNVSLNNYGEGYDSVYLKQNTSLPSQMYDPAYHHNSTYPHDDLVNAPLTPKSSTLTSGGTAPALIPPGMFAASSSPATTESFLRPRHLVGREMLTKVSMAVMGRGHGRRRWQQRRLQSLQLVALRRQRLQHPDGEAGQYEEQDEAADRHDDRQGPEPAFGLLLATRGLTGRARARYGRATAAQVVLLMMLADQH